jgi:hypothetical protein
VAGVPLLLGRALVAALADEDRRHQ